MNKNNLQYLEKDVIMGFDIKLPVRVIICRVSEQVKERKPSANYTFDFFHLFGKSSSILLIE